MRELVKSIVPAAHLYRDAAETNRNERFLILSGNDDVLGAGPTAMAAWQDAADMLDDNDA